MNFKNYILLPLLVLFSVAMSNSLGAQCLDWINPSETGGWTDFNSTFGGAPCDDGMGCAFNEIQAFEVFSAEAYSVDNFVAGSEYVFSMCNGPGAGTWVPEFTIIAPSGAVDAFGAGDGDACTITWTASEDGTYLIVINEAGACGGGDNTGVANGFPAITCTDGPSCDPPVTGCSAGTLLTTGTVPVCGDDATFDLMVEMDTIPTGGGFGYSFSDALGGAGGLAGGFSITSAAPEVAWDSDLGGILSSNALDRLVGTWVVRSITYSDAMDAVNTICDASVDSLVVEFGPVLVLDAVVDAGNGSAMATASGGTPPYTYLWSDANAQTTETATELMPGDYTVVVTDVIGCTAEGSVTIMSTAVETIESLESLTISPNPSTDGRFLVNVQLDDVRSLQVSILDVAGRVIAQQDRQTAADQITFDLSNQAAGVYLVRVQVDQEALYRRVVLTK